MAYEKQTWTNDTSAVLDTRMNHIEQGIYDNSLATDKINPSGTATTTAEIEEGQISDVIGFKSLKLKGQTSQDTTTGYNLLPPGESGTHIVNGLTHTSDGKGTYTLNGTASSTSRQDWAVSPHVIQSTDYLYLGNTEINNGITLALLSDTDTQIMYTGPSVVNRIVSLSSYEGQTINYVRTYSNAQTVSNFQLKPMICDSTSRTTFEQYSGGKASPNPDFPQDVNNVSGYNVIGISNKNLIEYSFKGYNINSQGKFETGGSSLDFDVHIAKVKAGTTYTITPATNVIAYFDEKPTLTSQAYNNSREVITSTNSLTPTRSGYIAMRTATSNTAQLEKGTSATTYIAHQGNEFEINLGKNILDYATNVIENALINTTGLIATTSECTTVWCKVKPNTTYTLSREKGDRIVIGGSNTQPALDLTTTLLKNEGVTEVKNYTFNSGNYQYVAIYISRYTSTRPTWVQVEEGSIATNYAPYFPPIEICKIGTYQDYIFKRNGKWWKHKEVGKVILDGVNYNASTKSGTTANIMYTTNNIPGIKPVANNGTLGNLMTSHFKNTTTDIIYSGDVIGIGQRTNEQISIGVGLSSTLTTLELFNTWLTNNNVDVYYPLATPTDEEITYTPLIRQLDELYNSGLYEVTNISQDNSSEAFILDIEACKNNINGIVEYIRR